MGDTGADVNAPSQAGVISDSVGVDSEPVHAGAIGTGTERVDNIHPVYPRPGEGSGIEWFVGAPESGKTTLALKHAFALVEMRRVPLIVVDNGHIPMFADKYHEQNIDELCEGVWREGVSCYYTPKDPLIDVDIICDACYEAKDCIILIDETNYSVTARSPVKSGFLRLMRSHQHCRVHVLCTTQHLSGDIPAACFSCAPHVYIFRTTSRPALKMIEEEWNLDRNTAMNLPQFEYREHYSGFGLDKATAAR